MELLIKNARIVDASKDFIGDIYINEKGIIENVGINLNNDCKVIDANGQTVMPAFVDLHAHFRDPGLTYKEDIETGSRAAVRGGYTTVNLMGNTKPIASKMETINYVNNKGREIGLCDLNQVASITYSLTGNDISHLDAIDSSVKFITDDGKGVDSDKIMLEAMVKAKEKSLTIMSHAETREIVPYSHRLAENLMTIRDIYLSRHTGCRLHLSHVSTKEAIEEIVRAKDQGALVTCEVTPHHIALTNEIEYRVNPPLREEEDRLAIIEAIKEGYVDAIATDHAPHTAEDKKAGSPGMVGLETSFAVCYTKLVRDGHITLNKLSEIMSKNPAMIMDINKGEITPGYIGDLVFVDLDIEETVNSEEFHSKGKNTPMDGMNFFGKVIRTVKSGKIVFEA